MLRRSAALALLFLLVAALGMLVWLPLHWIAWQDARLARLDEEIAELQRRLAEREEILAERRLIERALAEPGLILRAATPALAAAELQGTVTTMVRERGGQIASVHVLEPVELGAFTEVGLRIVLEADMEGLVGLLHAVETSRPLVLVRRLELDAEDPPADGGPPRLRAVVELAGLNQRPRGRFRSQRSRGRTGRGTEGRGGGGWAR